MTETIPAVFNTVHNDAITLRGGPFSKSSRINAAQDNADEQLLAQRGEKEEDLGQGYDSVFVESSLKLGV